MNFIQGIFGKDFVVICCDTSTFQHGLLITKSDHDSFYTLGSKVIMSIHGNGGDPVQFAEFIAKNCAYYKIVNGYELSPEGIANYTRSQMAHYLRTRDYYAVEMLIAGFDESEGPSLYNIDSLATLAKTKYSGHGYGSIFACSILDKYYHKDITKAEAVELMKKCIAEVKARLILNFQKFRIKIIDKDGVETLPDFEVQSSTTREKPAQNAAPMEIAR